MAIAEVTVFPLGTKETSLSKYVAGCHKVLKKQEKVEYELTPMGTILEGNINEIFDIVKKLHEVPFGEGAKRVSTNLKIDDRRDKKGSMKQKINSVNDKL
ncbi:MAG: MTH1187 family thiamine-binding protein [Bacillota bacterium]